jgi:hypothetical protein
MSRDKTIDKIRRLFNLAQSNNPHEAAAALSHAQAMMLKHAVDQGEVEKHDDSKVEPIGQHGFAKYSRSIPHWHLELAVSMSRGFMVKVYYFPGKEIMVVGRDSHREAFAATWRYVVDQIDHLADGAWLAWRRSGGADNAQRWKRSFCEGAVVTIHNRLAEDIQRLEAGAAFANVGTPAGESAAIAQSAIVLRDKNKEAQDWLVENVKPRSSRLRSDSRQYNSASANELGKLAGHQVNLNKRATRGLGDGQ